MLLKCSIDRQETARQYTFALELLEWPLETTIRKQQMHEVQNMATANSRTLNMKQESGKRQDVLIAQSLNGWILNYMDIAIHLSLILQHWADIGHVKINIIRDNIVKYSIYQLRFLTNEIKTIWLTQNAAKIKTVFQSINVNILFQVCTGIKCIYF